MNRLPSIVLIVGLAIGLGGSAAFGEPLGTEFTYQGQLKEAGSPADGTYDFDFSLYDGPDVGAGLVAGPIGINAVAVVDGLFTVQVDFGGNVFTGQALWLDITVNGAPLSPRQELTPAPHALALPGLWTQQNATCPNLIGGHHANTVTIGAVGATISGGGATNSVTGNYGTIGGGKINQAGDEDGDPTTAIYGTVSGGYSNTASKNLATVGGGFTNAASAETATVSGGKENTASGNHATVAGGIQNNATGYASVVGGGGVNSASNTYATIGGGYINTADATHTTVGGGRENTASALYATVPGGHQNTAAGNYSFAAGKRALADHTGSFVWSDSTTVDPAYFSSSAANQFLINATGGVGINTNGPGAALHLGDTGNPAWDGIMFPDGSLQNTAAVGGGGLWTQSGADVYYDNGNVGIGTPSPDNQLQVTGTGDSGSFGPTNWQAEFGEGGVGRVVVGSYEDQPAIQGHGTGTSFRLLLNPTGGNVGIGTAAPSATLDVAGSLEVDTSTLVVDATNNRVGIGTSNPAAPLDVVASASGVPSIVTRGGTDYATADGQNIDFGHWDGNSFTNRMRIDPSGNVGIGTSDPGSNLNVVGSSPGGPSSGQIRIDGSETSGAAGTGAGLRFTGHDGTVTRNWAAIQGLKENGTSGDRASFLRFSTRPSAGANTVERVRIDSDGNVGIGTGDPQATMHVNGNIKVGTGTRGFNLREVNTSDPDWGSLISYGGIGIGSADGANGQMIMFTDGAGSENIFTIATREGSASPWEADVTVLQNGRVGIGTTAPGAKLEVQSNSNLSTPQLLLTESAADFARLTFENTENTRFWTIAGFTGDDPDALPEDNLNFYHSTAGNGLSLRVGASGVARVGIGTPTPDERLHVDGHAKVEGNLRLYDTSGGLRYIAGRDGTLRLYDTNGGMRVSATAPTSGGALLLYRPDASGTIRQTVRFLGDGSGAAGEISLFTPDGLNETIEIIGAEGATNNGGQINLRKADGTATLSLSADGFDTRLGTLTMTDTSGGVLAKLYGDETFGPTFTMHETDLSLAVHISAGGAGSGGKIRLLDSTGGSGIELKGHGPGGQIKLSNSVGSDTIELDGQTGVTSTKILEITGADLAEKFPVSEEVKPGMVLEIDPDHPGELRVVRGAYNRRVAGVVSGANDLSLGVVLGNLPGHEDAPPIALSGRVYVWVDASNGPIEPGDLLTTSDTPGHAMKVTDHARAQGAIIGKAMSRLDEGDAGLVLVLVSLQ